MCTANQAARRTHSLSASLAARMQERCFLVQAPDSEPPGPAPLYQLKLCHSLGVCVCESDGYHMFQNLKALLKSQCWKKKKTKERSPARVALDDYRLFLEFRPRAQPAAWPLGDADAAGDEWDACFAQEQANNSVGSDASVAGSDSERFFFHIGHVNKISWHFACLEVYVVDVEAMEPQQCRFEPRASSVLLRD